MNKHSSDWIWDIRWYPVFYAATTLKPISHAPTSAPMRKMFARNSRHRG